MKRNALLLLLACLVGQLSGFSQGYVLNQLSVDDGLSNNTA